MRSEGEWSILVESLARELVPALRRRLYRAHFDRIRSMSSYAEKLVYLYLLLAQPQSFITILRALSMARKTADRVLRSLMFKEYLIQDNLYLYWVEEPE